MSDKRPWYVIPRIPGTSLVAAIGGVLLLILGGVVAVNWANGTLDDRLGGTIGARPEHAEPATPVTLESAPAETWTAPHRVQLVDPSGQPIDGPALAVQLGWMALGDGLWRWPAAGPEGAAIVEIDGPEATVSPLTEDLVDVLTAAAADRGLEATVDAI